MIVHNATNVCQALALTVDSLLTMGSMEPSRNGTVLVASCPIMTVTLKPTERVLFSPMRDANPFFHLAEAIWMLAGRNDGAFLTQYVKRFEEFTERNGTLHGAYGYRWRTAFGFDQLNSIVDKLKANPYDRQCVIQMWDAAHHIDFIDNNDLLGDWKDRPCNTHIYLRIREKRWLDLTVCCRSNDMIWGAHGANAVHFSILQEYLAARIGVQVGTMYQLSNNAHIYAKELDNLRTRFFKHHTDEEFTAYLNDNRYNFTACLNDNRYNKVSPLPMFKESKAIDEDIAVFFKNYDDDTLFMENYYNKWFYGVLAHALIAHRAYRNGRHDHALMMADRIAAADWRMACMEWLQRRAK